MPRRADAAGGHHAITLTVTDPHGGSASDTVVSRWWTMPSGIASIDDALRDYEGESRDVPVVVTVSVADACA